MLVFCPIQAVLRMKAGVLPAQCWNLVLQSISQVTVCVCVCVCVSCIESGRGWSVARVIDSTGIKTERFSRV